MEQSKVDNVEEYRSPITSIKNKDDIVDEVYKPRATSVANRPSEINLLEKITKPAEVMISQDNLYLSVFPGLVASLESITLDQKLIPLKNKRQ